MGSHSSVFRFLLLSLFFVFSASINLSAQEGDPSNGRSIFNANCAACHSLDKPITDRHLEVCQNALTMSGCINGLEIAPS